MVTFRNNSNRRNNFRRNDRSFKSNGDRTKFNNNFSSNENFQRKIPGRNNHNAPKLIEKYNNLAREALSNGDKILSENYFQHADHFTRVLSDQEIVKRAKVTENVITENSENSEKDSKEKISENLPKDTKKIQTEVN